MFKILLLFSLFLAAFDASPPSTGLLRIEVDNVQPGQGMIWIGLYKCEADFLIKEKAILRGIVVGDTSRMVVELPELPYGPYAMAVFQDENNNGEMDRNLIGIPSEPFAFSGPLKSKFRLPRYEEVRFEFRKSQQRIQTRLETWWRS